MRPDSTDTSRFAPFRVIEPDDWPPPPALPAIPTMYGSPFPWETARSFSSHCPDCGAALFRSGGCPVCDDDTLPSLT